MIKITITDEHLKLLQGMYITNGPFESIEASYGNSNVEKDICEILGKKKVEVDYDEGYLTEDLEYAAKLHLEMKEVLQVVLTFKSFEKRTYVRENTWSRWEVQNEVSNI